MKKTKKREREREIASADTFDWMPLVHVFRDAFEWSLDIAAELASDYPEEVATIERVRAYLRARLEGRRAVLAVDDALFTFAILLGAIERELAVRDAHSGATERWLDSIWLRQLAKNCEIAGGCGCSNT